MNPRSTNVLLVSILRTRLQFDPKMEYEKPLLIEIPSPKMSVKELKDFIHKRQSLLSTGENSRCSPSESSVIVPPEDQILILKSDENTQLHGTLLENEQPLSTYGVDIKIETNAFLRRTNRKQLAVAQFILIDQRFLTPSQNARYLQALDYRDYHGALRCSQM